jgi:hypothetical protein
MRTRIRVAFALLGAVAGAAVALTVALARPERQPYRPWGGPVHAARAWLEAVRLGDGTTACDMLDPMTLERLGGTVGGCSRHFAEPRPMRFRIVSVHAVGGVYEVGVAAGDQFATIDVEVLGTRYRILHASFREGMLL